VHGNNAANVQLHFVTVNGGIDIHGGAGPFGGPFDITWNTIEDSRVDGGVTIQGYVHKRLRDARWGRAITPSSATTSC
jgi:hypothetical protein